MSLTYRGAIVQLLITLALIFGVNVKQDDIEVAVSVAAAFVAAGITLYGRWKAGGITVVGTRKKK
jgi:O-antigen/teichoic acid export membrane protein